MNVGHHRFETDRTKRFRQTSLPKLDEEAIRNIEEYGCHVVQVARSARGPGWSYTIGVYDTCAKPELITVGLRESTALYLLNEAAKRLRDGIDLSHGRQSGLLGTVECEFRPVDPKWVKHVMGWAVWFYDGGLSFPVWQAVYADLQNRFPEDPEFDPAFAQPKLQLGSFWVTRCQEVESLLFPVFIIRLILIHHSRSLLISPWDGGQSELDRAGRGFGTSTKRAMVMARRLETEGGITFW